MNTLYTNAYNGDQAAKGQPQTAQRGRSPAQASDGLAPASFEQPADQFDPDAFNRRYASDKSKTPATSAPAKPRASTDSR